METSQHMKILVTSWITFINLVFRMRIIASSIQEFFILENITTAMVW